MKADRTAYPFHYATDSADARRVIKAGTNAARLDLERTPAADLDPSNPNHPSHEWNARSTRA